MRFTKARQAEFIERLRENGGVVSYACRDVGIGRRTVYELRDRDESFREAWDEAVEHGTASLEAEAIRRARDGVSEPVFYKGAECGTVQRYSDSLLIFLLKSRRPETYRDRSSVQVENVGNENRTGEQFDVSLLAPYELQEMDRLMKKSNGVTGSSASLKPIDPDRFLWSKNRRPLYLTNESVKRLPEKKRREFLEMCRIVDEAQELQLAARRDN